MTNPLLDAYQLELRKGTPDKATALIRVLEHQFYMRDRADGDLHRRIDSLLERIKRLENHTHLDC